ncbi:putative G-protein coupled receptor Mth-like 3 [Chionoecetes opilio]|uniref:Putative G-protein coupled receptor Mth-like 3 n=1 Tax=Chionoecetes opilio TaxID=41210 RepID=A0A8J4YIV7_CHIOP|nr:putative G-protein coupled receptor Mth-like 3 [Chionoecetes opilio]
MLIPLDSRHAMTRRWSVVILLMTLLIQQGTSSENSTGTTLRKCHCNQYQGWDGTKCIDSVTNLLVYNGEIDLKTGDISMTNVILVNTSDVEGVMVKELHCPNHLFHATIKNNIVLLRDGRLLLLDTMSVFTSETFCIVNFWEMGQTYFDAQVCMPPPAVPHCCPANHILDPWGSCHPQEGLQAPPLQLGDRLLDWDNVGGDMVPLTCGEHEHYKQIPLQAGKAELRLSSSQPIVIFGWRAPFFVSSVSWQKEYCVALQETETKELQYLSQICFKDYERYLDHQCNGSLCVRKCCPSASLMHHDVCVEALAPNEIWHPSQIPGQEVNDQWNIVIGEAGCQTYRHYEEIKLLPNGWLELSPDSPSVSPTQYCLDNILNDDETIDQLVMLCYPSETTTCLWRDIVIKVMLGLSCVFLVATLAVYLGVAELRDHTYGRCLISMVAAMLTAYICFLCGPRATDSEATCLALAFVTHLSSLAVFFWLNVMCYDMWKILRGSTKQHHSMKVFSWYSLYAWGCPLLVSVVALILDVTAPQNILLPEYFNGSCWFKAVTLYQKMKQRTQNFHNNTSRTNKTTHTKNQVWLFAKLFVVMGVVWITDSFSTLSHRKTCSYWVLTDIINGLQGVFIFIVAVCNKDNLKKVKDAWRPRIQVMRQTISSLPGQSSQSTTRSTLSIDDTDTSRKTSITSLPRKISLASNIFFSSSKKSATLNIADSGGDHSGRKLSNVSIKEITPLASMQE